MEHPAYRLVRPRGASLPIVVDSPHSGVELPADFHAIAPQSVLRRLEDAFVDRLWADAPEHGATLLAARFARSYIDVNRSTDDPARLVWREIQGCPVYARAPTAAQLQSRIERCWQPYHQALQGEVQQAVRRHGGCWHLDVHSMPDDSLAGLGEPGEALADFVLGDLGGRSAGEALVRLLERSLRAEGFTVARNRPFRGAEILRRSGDPGRGRHAVQVEVRRSLYMDAASHRPHAGFDRVRRALERVMASLADHVRQQLAASGRGLG